MEDSQIFFIHILNFFELWKMIESSHKSFSRKRLFCLWRSSVSVNDREFYIHIHFNIWLVC